MKPSSDELQKHYRNLSDEDIEQLILYEAKDLTPEAQHVLKEEAKRRSIAHDLTDAIHTQEHGVSEQELQVLIARVSQLPCPMCHQKTPHLNASTIAIAQSALIVTAYKESLMIGCPECLLTKAQEARKKTLLYGWWAIPWGPIRTLKALAINNIATDPGRYENPTPEFLEFVRSHAPAIQAKMETLTSIDELLSM